MFDALFKALDFAKGTVQWMLELGDEKRKKFASYCDEIVKLLDKYLNSSDDERQLMNLCTQLKVHVEPIRVLAKDTVSTSELESVALELDQVCETWRAQSDAAKRGDHSYVSNLGEVDEAKNHFIALATRVRLM